MVEVDHRRTLQQQHVVVPINEVAAVVISLLVKVPELVVPELVHIEGHFHRPALDDLAELVPLLEPQQLQADQLLQRSHYRLLVVDEVQQVLSQLVHVPRVALPDSLRGYLIMALP